MKNSIHKFTFGTALSLLLGGMLLLSGCDTASTPAANEELTQAEAQAASEIIGESLSSDYDGVMSTVYDATATVSTDGISYIGSGSSGMMKTSEATVSEGMGGNSGRGHESNFEHTYDPETGTHYISFERDFQNPRMEKTMQAELTYVFRDTAGQFIEHPRLDYDKIEETDYTGMHTGTMSNQRRTSEYLRKDTLFVSGISSASDILKFHGTHYGTGAFEISSNNATVTRNYEIAIQFNDIEIDKAVVQENGTLEEGVTGSMTYDMSFYLSNAQGEKTQDVSGTIEFTGDGTALLRFKHYPRFFRLDLFDGTSVETAQ